MRSIVLGVLLLVQYERMSFGFVLQTNTVRRLPLLLSASEEEAAAYEMSVSGLRWRDEIVGQGEATPQKGDIVVIDYRGSLVASGSVFDQSYDRGAPFSFELGKRTVIPGMEEGVLTMKIGGKRTLLIPPRLAYGDRDVGDGKIPANSELKFEIELKEIKSGAIAATQAKAQNFGQNLLANIGPNPFTFFTALFLLSTVAPIFIPEQRIGYTDTDTASSSSTMSNTDRPNTAKEADLSALLDKLSET